MIEIGNKVRVRKAKIFLLIISYLICSLTCLSQSSDSLSKLVSIKKVDPTHIYQKKPELLKSEILSGGFVDVVQNGQMNASARLFRLYIGEPGKFQLPLTLYTGVTANHFTNARATEDMVISLINPGTGVFNLSMDGIHHLVGKKESLTSLKFQYQTGVRYLNVYNKILYRNTSFFNLITAMGFTFITGAWERNRINNLGLFWLNLRALYSLNPSYALEEFFNSPINHNIMGLSGGMGIENSQALNVKIFYFHFLTNREFSAFTQPYLQLSFNYTLR